MTRILLLILIICCSLVAKADLPGPAYQYDRYSENGKFYFKSIPYYNYDLTSFGKTIIYYSEGNEELYTLDNYLPSEAFISNDSRSLVTTTYWMWGHSDYEDQILIKIYLDRKDSIQYRIDDLVSDKSKLQNTSSHTLWYKQMFVKGDTLFVMTLENKVVKIDMQSGEIIEKINVTDCKICSDSDNIPAPKTKYYSDIKYPDGYIFPDLENGKQFRQSLIEGLNKDEVEDYAECEYYILVYGTIDKKGECVIFMIQTSVNGEENSQWNTMVSDWIIAQKYQTDLIPENCDKWVFEEYFYLK